MLAEAAGSRPSWAGTSARRWSSGRSSSGRTTGSCSSSPSCSCRRSAAGVDVALYTNIARGPPGPPRHGRGVPGGQGAACGADGSGRTSRPQPRRRRLPRAWGAAATAPSLAWYGMDRPGRGAPEAWVEDGWLIVGGERVASAVDVRLPGRHMLADVLGAALAARLIGVDASAIATAMRARSPGSRIGSRPSPSGTACAGSTTRRPRFRRRRSRPSRPSMSPIVLIAGGKDKGLDYAAFADAIASRVRALVLIGETADELEALVVNRVPVRRASSMDEAVAVAAEIVASRATSRCCRRRPRASTCSSTTPPAATPSAPRSSGRRRADDGRVDRRRPAARAAATRRGPPRAPRARPTRSCWRSWR